MSMPWWNEKLPVPRIIARAGCGLAFSAPASASAEKVAIAAAIERRMQRRALRTGWGVLVAMRPPSARVQTAPSWAANGSLTAYLHGSERVLQSAHERLRVPAAGPARGARRAGPLAVGRAEAARPARAVAVRCGARRHDRPPDRRALGRAAAAHGRDVAPELRLAAA